MYKQILLLFIILFSFNSIHANRDSVNSKLIFVGGNNPPYEYYNDFGTITGFHIDLIKELMKRMDRDFEIKLLPLSKATNMVENDNNTFFMGIAYSDTLTYKYSFSIPHSYIYLSIITPKSVSYKTIYDLKDKEVIVTDKSFASGVVLDKQKQYNLKPVFISATQEGFEMIKNGIGDAFITNSMIARYIIDNKNYSININQIKEIDAQKYCIASNIKNENIIMEINACLSDMKKDGSYYAIYDKWFNDYSDIKIPYNIKILLYSICSLLFLTIIITVILRYKFKKTSSKVNKQNSEIKKINEQLSLIIKNTNTGYVYLSPTLNIIWENVSLCNVFTYCSDYKKIGAKCYSVITDKEICKTCPVRKSIFSGRMEKVEITNSVGMPIEMTSIPVYDKEEDLPKGYILKLDDITQQIKSKNELIAAKEKAEESEKMKSAFLSNISHEIRTPLNSIVGFSSLLATEENENQKKEFLKIIEHNNELMLNIVNDLIYLSKAEVGYNTINIFEFNINDMLTNLKSKYKDQVVGENITIELSLPMESCIISTDYHKVEHIIVNYLSNAIKHTTEGQITIGYCMEDENIRLFVKDTGCGISKENIPLLFTRFEKVDSFKQGLGIGLSICQNIASRLGGEVGVTSKEAEGSTFWALLPITFKCVIPKSDPLHYS